jgi:signal transduction histidine kinase
VITTSLVIKDKQEYGKITIWDNGIGIPDSYLQNVFDPFFSTKTATKEHGVGLGLSISYGIITDHNGEIQIKSVPREFTKIEIFLPVKTMNTSKVSQKD